MQQKGGGKERMSEVKDKLVCSNETYYKDVKSSGDDRG